MLRFRQSGLTLIELMIAIALVAILTAVAFPSFSTWLANLKVRAVAESVSAGMHAARVEAAKRNATVRFHLDSAVGGGWTVSVVDGGAIVEQKSAGQGGSVMVTVGEASIEFNSLGQRSNPDAAVGTIVANISKPDSGSCQADGGSVRCLMISISVNGQVRLCDPARPDGDPQAC